VPACTADLHVDCLTIRTAQSWNDLQKHKARLFPSNGRLNVRLRLTQGTSEAVGRWERLGKKKLWAGKLRHIFVPRSCSYEKWHYGTIEREITAVDGDIMFIVLMICAVAMEKMCNVENQPKSFRAQDAHEAPPLRPGSAAVLSKMSNHMPACSPFLLT